MRDMKFGVSIAPTLDIAHSRALAQAAERSGLDLVGIQDHPYVPDYLDAFALIGDLLARTESIHFFPDVANLPLRPAPMLARAGGSLSRMSGGRFQLGLGAGGYWDAITTLGVERRTPAEALEAQGEAITLLRRLWQPSGAVSTAGRWYSVDRMASQAPAPGGIEIWVGAQGPRSLALTGRVADGWAAPIPSYLPYERWADSNVLIDRAAVEAGRSPDEVRRLGQLVGTIAPNQTVLPGLTGSAPVRASIQSWIDLLTRLGEDEGFTGFVFWPEQSTEEQIRLFGEEVAPAVRTRLLG